MWRYEKLTMNGFKRDRGRLKKYLQEVIRDDMTQFKLIEEMNLDKRA